MLNLILLRHAEAGMAAADFSRPLTAFGREQAHKVGLKLASTSPYYALVSSAQRTQETFDLAAQSWELEGVTSSDKLYNASSEILLEELAKVPAEERNVILIAHNPGISILADELSKTSLFTGFAPAEWCHLRFAQDSWADIHPCSGEMINE